MSYSAPAGNAIEFTLDAGQSYAPAAGNAIAFELFAEAVPTRYLDAAGELALRGGAALAAGAALQGGAALSFGGGVDVRSGGRLECAGGLQLSGAAEVLAETRSLTVNARLTISGSLSAVVEDLPEVVTQVAARLDLRGYAEFTAGATLRGRGAFRFGGAAKARAGRVLGTAAGKLEIRGQSTFRHGCKATLSAPLVLNGNADMNSFSPRQMAGEGALLLGGRGVFSNLRETSSADVLWVRPARNALAVKLRKQEIFCHV